jgi:orotate phosphoribosyltransferase-like protein
MAALLTRLLEEVEGGLLTTIENRAIAVTFDDFLDHGAEYLKHGRKDEAAVIAGIVFEDTTRRICRVLGLAENGVALETLISELAKRDPPVLTSLKAKRARAASGLRTSAANARWEEIERSDVGPVIELTKELIETHLI